MGAPKSRACHRLIKGGGAGTASFLLKGSSDFPGLCQLDHHCVGCRLTVQLAHCTIWQGGAAQSAERAFQISCKANHCLWDGIGCFMLPVIMGCCPGIYQALQEA
eukprot:1159852-Pelagomonas_calceolata.AAC.1